MANRVSWKVVEEILSRNLTSSTYWGILGELREADDEERAAEIGMTYGEWKKRFDDHLEGVVWAADTNAGFGHKGDPVYGNADDLKIVKIVTTARGKTLYLWEDILGDWREGE